MKLALVVLNYNDADNTLKILGNVADYSVFDKVIVVDNASNDDSTIRLKSFCEKREKILFVLRIKKTRAMEQAIMLAYL